MSFVKTKKNSQDTIFKVLRQISYTKLFKKYSSGNYSYNKISINNLLFKENCLIVARFKDFLILDDNTEFFRRYYPDADIKPKLMKILNFYEKYSKVFPNYLILKENEYLYRNIRRKQKMIDAVNEIKMEEKENRRKLKSKENEKNDNELFTKKIKNEIKKFQNNASFKNYKNSLDSDTNNEDTLVINQNSLYLNNKQFKDDKKDSTNIDSFVGNQTNGSITYLVNVLNDNKIYTKDLPNIFIQNNNTIIIQKNQKITQGIEINNKANDDKIQEAKGPEEQKEPKEQKYNLITNVNNLTNKENNEIQRSKKHIKNNSLIKMKKIVDKNSLYKYTFSTSHATSSSITIGVKNKNDSKPKSPFINEKTKDNSESKNSHKNIDNNKDNLDINNNNIKCIKELNTKNSKTNLYQKTFYNTNKKNTFKKILSSKNNTDKISQDTKENLQKNKDDNDNNKKNNNRKEKYKINKEIVKKKYIKGKHMSQDFDFEKVYEMTENILNVSKNNSNKNKSTNIIINTENINSKTKKNFLINDNPNLITGDTKSNDRNEKNFMEDNDIIKIRDIFKNEKKETEIFYTARKPNKDSLLKLIKKKTNENGLIKDLKFYELKSNYSNSIDNKCKKKLISNDNDNISNSLRNNSEITKQKTEFKFVNKKLMTKDLKKNTKQIFSKNNIKNSDTYLKTSINFNNVKKLFIKKDDSGIKEINCEFYNTTRNHKFYNKKERKSDSTFIPLCEKKIVTERKMATNLSENNMKKNNMLFKSAKKTSKAFKSKINLIKNNSKINSKNNSKIFQNSPDKKYKSFITKKINRKNGRFNSNSHSDLFSFDILNKIHAVKHNKTKNDFYKNVKNKKSKNCFNTNNSSRSTSQKKNNHDNKTTTTPLNNKIIHFFNKHISRPSNDACTNRTKDDLSDNFLSSFSIKVNKTIYNKEKDKDKEWSNNKNLKKTWSKNMKAIVNQIKNNIHKEYQQQL